jgi:hypothetical protein
MSYLTGLIGVWLICDGLISIRLYLNTLNETGHKLQSWKYDHSIRILRCIMGLALVVIGAM